MASVSRHNILGSNVKCKSVVEKGPTQCVVAAKWQGLRLWNSKRQHDLQGKLCCQSSEIRQRVAENIAGSWLSYKDLKTLHTRSCWRLVNATNYKLFEVAACHSHCENPHSGKIVSELSAPNNVPKWRREHLKLQPFHRRKHSFTVCNICVKLAHVLAQSAHAQLSILSSLHSDYVIV